MKRRLFNLAAVVSLVLCVATAALWVRGIWFIDTVSRNRATERWVVAVGGGEVGLFRFPHGPEGYNGWDFDTHDREGFVTHPLWFHSEDVLFPEWSVPMWLVWLGTLLPFVIVIRSKRRSPSRSGFCPTCGYDLRATPDRCPECGAVPDQSAIASS